MQIMKGFSCSKIAEEYSQKGRNYNPGYKR